ncbi:2-oxo-tetronate isomerase [Propylenella binzhouense]|uniref:Hydroxypyruvate isomerase n=1 Tax=Propylenella binzhouense TaxID=2555902 RepID=A0A964T471_9HYPH|nr:2-oxo-tetronate isomerase [Propylenella binzhouense]MYZ48181.1 hydroxypyruvate isomerase [Propylenella binzhouense]
MPRFSANLTMLFNEVPFLDRFEAAAQAGFRGVEFLFPYDFAADEIAARLQRHSLALALHNLPAGDWPGGERGIACIPGREAEFRQGVETAIAYARALHCPQLNCLAGIAPSGTDPQLVRSVFVDNLRYAAGRLAEEGLRLLTEPINTRDIPGFFLTTTRQAREILNLVGSDNLYIQYDAYHMQVMEGDLARTIEANLDRIAHIQIADNPGRHEPGTGEINFDFLFRHLDAIGYPGWVGCEYKPAGRTRDGLGWMGPVQQQRAVA